MNLDPNEIPLGASYEAHPYEDKGHCRFLVWAPYAKKVDLIVKTDVLRQVGMKPLRDGYYFVEVENVPPRSTYQFQIDDKKSLPDPASKIQFGEADGVSMTVNPSFGWQDDGWQGFSIKGAVIYEIHVGTYSDQGSFSAIIGDLKRLSELGIDAIQLMPVNCFPGSRNWGYDGVLPYSVHRAYGGPQGLKQLVNACHKFGIAVILDVVYNHLGPEANCMKSYGPYFNPKKETPWGNALHFDHPQYAKEIRRFFIEQALYFLREFHIDGLRIDAAHMIFDESQPHFLAELQKKIKAFQKSAKRSICLIAESGKQDRSYLRQDGYAFDGMYNDDFHHSLHVLLTEEKQGYFSHYGDTEQLQKTFVDGFVFDDTDSPSHPDQNQEELHKLLVFSQNHDQAGNRALGERSSSLLSFEQLKLSAVCQLLHPSACLLFMGEEYGETAPFTFFIDHKREEIIEAVRQGRLLEFANRKWQAVPPDPKALSTYSQCKLQTELRHHSYHKILNQLYTILIRIRRALFTKGFFDQPLQILCSDEKQKSFMIEARHDEHRILFAYNCSHLPVTLRLEMDERKWFRLVNSDERKWQGKNDSRYQLKEGMLSFHLSPYSVLVIDNCQLDLDV